MIFLSFILFYFYIFNMSFFVEGEGGGLHVMYFTMQIYLYRSAATNVIRLNFTNQLLKNILKWNLTVIFFTNVYYSVVIISVINQ